MGLTGRLVSLPAGAMQISYKLAGKALYKNFPPSSNVAETQNTSSVPLRVSTWGCKKISKGCKYAATALHKESSLRETTDESSSSAPESALSSLTVSNEVEQDETEEVKGLLDVSEENSIRWMLKASYHAVKDLQVASVEEVRVEQQRSAQKVEDDSGIKHKEPAVHIDASAVDNFHKAESEDVRLEARSPKSSEKPESSSSSEWSPTTTSPISDAHSAASSPSPSCEEQLNLKDLEIEKLRLALKAKRAGKKPMNEDYNASLVDSEERCLNLKEENTRLKNEVNFYRSALKDHELLESDNERLQNLVDSRLSLALSHDTNTIVQQRKDMTTMKQTFDEMKEHLNEDRAALQDSLTLSGHTNKHLATTVRKALKIIELRKKQVAEKDELINAQKGEIIVKRWELWKTQMAHVDAEIRCRNQTFKHDVATSPSNESAQQTAPEAPQPSTIPSAPAHVGLEDRHTRRLLLARFGVPYPKSQYPMTKATSTGAELPDTNSSPQHTHALAFTSSNSHQQEDHIEAGVPETAPVNPSQAVGLREANSPTPTPQPSQLPTTSASGRYAAEENTPSAPPTFLFTAPAEAPAFQASFANPQEPWGNSRAKRGKERRVRKMGGR